MAVLVIGLNHRTAPVALRERFAIPEARVPSLIEEMRSQHLVDEAVILSTCNRVEIYAVTQLDPSQAFTELKAFMARCAQCHEPRVDEVYQHTEPRSLEHLFKVACGLDSMVLGETEIFGQLKKAYELAFQHKCTGGILNKAFQKAFHVAKYIRSETNIQRGSISVASVAVELAEKVFSSLDDRQVMVIGAGDTSEKAARALLSRGAKSIVVANRSYDRAVALAGELGGRAIRFEDWTVEFERMDIAISSTAAPHYILNRERLEPLMKLRRHRPLLLIDIAVPRDIDPEVNFLDDVYLYNIDDLQAIADDYLRRRQAEITRCEGIVREKVRALMEVRHFRSGPVDSPPLLEHD